MVSILLLLELPWWQGNDAVYRRQIKRFNPSFTGIALVAGSDRYYRARGFTFQSFFYWNCLGGQNSIDIYARWDVGFNPSFTGIALVASIFFFNQQLKTKVSILLLLELPWWQIGTSLDAGMEVMFQSFFYWNCLGGALTHALAYQVGISFNPSFTGIALVAKLGFSFCNALRMFQSFFYWNCLGGDLTIKVTLSNVRVSILLLLELPWWLSFLYLWRSSINNVSILLLLELPWWPFVVCGCGKNYFMFQSFFYWNCLGGPAAMQAIFYVLFRFNPSFTGIALVATPVQFPGNSPYAFQSFFYWNCLGGIYYANCSVQPGQVSILLLLELPWWL